MPIRDNGDPNIEPGKMDFPKFEKGSYGVIGVDGFFKSCCDDENLPYYKPVGSDMKVMFNFKLQNNEMGPPCSLSAPQLVAYAHACGVDVTKLPSDRSSTAFLVAWKDAVNAAKKPLTVEVVKDGWVGYIPAAQPPTGITGIFQFEFVKMYSMDGQDPPTFLEDDFGNSKVGVLYRIVAGQNGEPTPFEGYEVKVALYNPFGEPADGMVTMKVNQNGSRPTAVSRFYNFCEAFMANRLDFFENHVFTPEEVQNPLLAVMKHITPGRRIKAMLELTDGTSKRLKIDLLQIEILGGTTPVAPPKVSSVPASAQTSERPNLDALTGFIDMLCMAKYGELAFSPEKVLTSIGTTFAKETFAADWVANNMPAHKRFAALTEEEAGRFHAILQAKYEPQGEAPF